VIDSAQRHKQRCAIDDTVWRLNHSHPTDIHSRVRQYIARRRLRPDCQLSEVNTTSHIEEAIPARSQQRTDALDGGYIGLIQDQARHCVDLTAAQPIVFIAPQQRRNTAGHATVLGIAHNTQHVCPASIVG
jgi:hypothetical protein